ncbi:MAG: hypothetical protein KAS11_02680 [Candidatus Aenigmarchaeota archaeon]|nr:hypothetical protein [Candidatus Aenigmarchaeota archaeon]
MSTYLWDLEHKSFDFSEVEELIKSYVDRDVAGKAYEMFEFLYNNDESFFLESYIQGKGFASGFIVLSAACLAYEVDNMQLSNVYSVCRAKACSNAKEFYGMLVKCDGWADVFKELKIPLLCDEMIQR